MFAVLVDVIQYGYVGFFDIKKKTNKKMKKSNTSVDAMHHGAATLRLVKTAESWYGSTQGEVLNYLVAITEPRMSLYL